MLKVVFPVVCPECKQESLSSLPAATINLALLSEAQLTLRSSCHQATWRASAPEVDQIREYLWAAQIV